MNQLLETFISRYWVSEGNGRKFCHSEKGQRFLYRILDQGIYIYFIRASKHNFRNLLLGNDNNQILITFNLMTPSKDAMKTTSHPTLSKSSINHSPADMSERYTCYLEKQDLYQQLDIKRQCDIIYYYKSERFSTVKETVNDNPTVHLIQPTSDDHLYPLGNRKVLLCNENRLPTLNDTADINHRNRINKKNLLILIYKVRRKRKKGILPYSGTA